jgi:hypothetical protein
MTVPTAIYGSETWIVRKNNETGIQAEEIRFLHGVARYTSTDHQHNKEIRKILEVFNLNIKIQN